MSHAGLALLRQLADKTELTGLLREGPHGDQLDGRPVGMRVLPAGSGRIPALS